MVDTTVLLAGIVWPRFPYEVLQHAVRGDYQLVVCPYVLTQARRKFGELFPAHLEEFEALLTDMRFEEADDPEAEEVAANRSLMRDETDVPVGLAAINAGVDYFVSDDKDFTDPQQPIHQKLAGAHSVGVGSAEPRLHAAGRSPRSRHLGNDGTLNLSAFYASIKAVLGHPGHPATDPRVLLALWLFATTEGIGSARQLERLCEEHDACR